MVRYGYNIGLEAYLIKSQIIDVTNISLCVECQLIETYLTVCKKMHRQKMKVIEGLLKKFNMEKVMEHYRSLNGTDYQWDPKELSLDSEMSGIKVKSHLESLMGTDVVKLNDRQYMLTLQEKLVKEHEQTINKQEELRSEKEKKRQRRLYIDGLQDLPNIDLRSTKEKQPKSKSAPTNGASRKIIAEDDETYMSRMGRQNPDRTRYTSYSERNRVTKSTPKASTQAEDLASDVYDHEDVHRHERFEHEDSDLDMTERGRLMKQLRREKTVDGLYTTADLVLAAPITELTDVVGNVRGSPRGSEYPMQEERKISGLALNSPTNKAAELVAVPEEELHPADADRATAVEDRAQADTLDRNNSAADTKISENFTLNAEPTGQS